MENIKDSFRVDTSLDTTWNTLLDIERIAPSMPGAQLQEIEGDEFRGIVKVKVGPITAQYKGAAKLAKVDEATRTITIDASGRDTRGQGNASAMITVVMRDDNGGTVVDIDTALQVTGKVAQFGRGVMTEVSAKILKQFVANLERDVLSSTPEPAPEVAAPVAPASSNGAAASAAPSVRVIDSPEAEPVDLMDAAGASVVKRAVPLFIAALVLFVVIRRTRRRRGRD
ncbi:MAG TPA: SRPBCC family protein [Acidimicrobiia bacterium]